MLDNRKFVDDLDEENFAAKAITVTTPTQEAVQKIKKPRAKKPVLLEQVSLKLHPDTVREIEQIAETERKLPSEVMRDLIGKGIQMLKKENRILLREELAIHSQAGQ